MKQHKNIKRLGLHVQKHLPAAMVQVIPTRQVIHKTDGISLTVGDFMPPSLIYLLLLPL